MELSAGVLERLEQQAIEVPSWAYGNSGTRFKVFAQAGVPRDPFEKLADAAQVHSLTGVAPSVALHIPWDDVDDFTKLGEHAASLGIRIGTINSNTFQDDIYKLGSLTHAERSVRRAAIDHHFRCIEIMNETGSHDLKVWLADGTNYPGQDDIRTVRIGLAGSLAVIYAAPVGRSAVGARVQVLRAGLLPHRCARLGHGVRAMRGAW